MGMNGACGEGGCDGATMVEMHSCGTALTIHLSYYQVKHISRKKSTNDRYLVYYIRRYKSNRLFPPNKPSIKRSAKLNEWGKFHLKLTMINSNYYTLHEMTLSCTIMSWLQRLRDISDIFSKIFFSSPGYKEFLYYFRNRFNFYIVVILQ